MRNVGRDSILPCKVKSFKNTAGTLLVRLYATLISSAILLTVIPCVAGQGAGSDFSYTGYSDATGASATLTFTITGTTVTGALNAADVCKENAGLSGYTAHLPGTDIKFTGAVVGGTWEGPSTTIVGTWTGGETRPCGGGIITNDPAFPNAGTLRIWLTPNNEVHLNRNLPRGLDFIFRSTGRVYIPSGAGPGGAGPGVIWTAPPGAEYQILDHGMGRGIDEQYRLADRTETFSTEDEKMWFWLQIGPTTRSHQIGWKWYSPDGELYYEDDITTVDPKSEGLESYNTREAWVWIEIKEHPEPSPVHLPGDWHVDIYIDGTYVGTEQFTIATAGPSVVGTGADLTIKELSIPTGMKPGMTAEIEVTFTNKGDGDAGPFSLYGYAFAKENYQYSLESEAVPIPGLAAGETQTKNLIISIPSDAPSGPWDVEVAIDNSNFSDTGSVMETDENNNEEWKTNVS